MRKWIAKILRIRICLKCLSFRQDHSYWHRGYNSLCQQADGDYGTRCYDCGNIVWDQSKEDYDKNSPDWCGSYPEKKLINGKWKQV